MIHVSRKINIKVTLTPAQVKRLKRDVVEPRGHLYNALYYADIHYNTFFKALEGNPIKKEQREKLIEFCDLLKQEKNQAA